MQPDSSGRNNEIRLSVIIPVFNSKALTLQCIEQLYAHTNRQASIIIVDAGSKDGTSEEIKLEYPFVHVVHGAVEWQYSKSVNEGLKYALEQVSSNAYLLLNSDVVLNSNYLSAVTAALQQYNHEPVLFGSVSFNAQDTTHAGFFGIKRFIAWRNKSYRYTYDDYLNAKKENVKFFESVFLQSRGIFFSKDTLLKNGFPDEDFLQYVTDYEFSARSKFTGIKTIVWLDAVLYIPEEIPVEGSTKNKRAFRKFISRLFNK